MQGLREQRARRLGLCACGHIEWSLIVGEVAGIAGIAIGAVLFLVRPLIDKLGILPPAQRGPMV